MTFLRLLRIELTWQPAEQHRSESSLRWLCLVVGRWWLDPATPTPPKPTYTGDTYTYTWSVIDAGLPYKLVQS